MRHARSVASVRLRMQICAFNVGGLSPSSESVRLEVKPGFVTTVREVEAADPSFTASAGFSASDGVRRPAVGPESLLPPAPEQEATDAQSPGND